MSSSMTSRRAEPHDLSSHHSKGKRCFSTLSEELVLHNAPKLAPSWSGPRIFQQDSAIGSEDCNCSSDGLFSSLSKAQQFYQAVVRCELLLIQRIHQVNRHAYLFGIRSR